MKEKHLEAIINKMFEIAGIDMDYRRLLGRKDDWYQQYQMTEDQCDQWVTWGSEYLYKNRVYTKARSRKQMSYLNLMYGLKIKDNGNKKEKEEVQETSL